MTASRPTVFIRGLHAIEFLFIGEYLYIFHDVGMCGPKANKYLSTLLAISAFLGGGAVTTPLPMTPYFLLSTTNAQSALSFSV